MTRSNVTKIEEFQDGFLITPPNMDDRILRLFSVMDTMLEYIFSRVELDEAERLCEFFSQRLMYYCRKFKDIEKKKQDIIEHRRGQHKVFGDIE